MPGRHGELARAIGRRQGCQNSSGMTCPPQGPFGAYPSRRPIRWEGTIMTTLPKHLELLTLLGIADVPQILGVPKGTVDRWHSSSTPERTYGPSAFRVGGTEGEAVALCSRPGVMPARRIAAHPASTHTDDDPALDVRSSDGGAAKSSADWPRSDPRARLAAEVRRTVENFPPLTVEQRARLARILTSHTSAYRDGAA